MHAWCDERCEMSQQTCNLQWVELLWQQFKKVESSVSLQRNSVKNTFPWTMTCRNLLPGSLLFSDVLIENVFNRSSCFWSSYTHAPAPLKHSFVLFHSLLPDFRSTSTFNVAFQFCCLFIPLSTVTFCPSVCHPLVCITPPMPVLSFTICSYGTSAQPRKKKSHLDLTFVKATLCFSFPLALPLPFTHGNSNTLWDGCRCCQHPLGSSSPLLSQ